MKLKCNINRKKFPIVQGVTFCEEYNETLDSGTIIITHVSKIRNLKPYDDVFIYDNEFNGFDENGVVIGSNRFYKHMLVQNFTEEIINLKDGIYSYTISLMSEIKALEKVQLPNISVTQPLKKSKKVSIYEYLCRFVELYSPKIKKKNGTRNTWEYKPKYKVDPKLKDVFGDTYSPDFSLNLPSLREVLAQLMIVKDMIPYVENNVIKAMDITLRKKEFNLDVGHMNYITGTMNADNYCTAVKRTYTDALSQDNTCRSIEKLTFRNSDTALMTIENMRVETRFPIYKINKIYMCYYKKADLFETLPDKFFLKNPSVYTFLCKQDITPLVKLNTERLASSRDWLEFRETPPSNVEELSKNYICTVGYDIGSKYITGWGEKQTIPFGWWGTKTTSVVENILNFMDYFYPIGVYSYDELMADMDDAEKKFIYKETREFKNSMAEILGPFAPSKMDKLFNSLLNIKGVFFIVDYQGFFEGSVVHSKDLALDDYITTNDNASSSLSLLEKDGLSQKEKVNRLGNKTIQISARYDNIEDMQNLGDVYNNDDDTDVIIYHREYSIYDNVINVNYFGAKDYVLKNYYTSVFARHRTWNLMPYGESVRRSENRKKYLLLSKEKSYYEKPFDVFFGATVLENNLLISAITPSNDDFTKMNFGYIEHKNGGQSSYYLTEVNGFSTGNSICFNLGMVDNISVGTYIETLSPFADYVDENGVHFENFAREVADVKDDYTGSKIGLYKIVDDDDTGYIKELNFYISSKEDDTKKQVFKKFYVDTGIHILENEGVRNYIYDIYNDILKLPKISSDSEMLSYENKIYTSEHIYKDNKEQIDMTFQIETIAVDESVVIGPWFSKLNDMLSNYNKSNNFQRKEYNPSESNFLTESGSAVEVLYSSIGLSGQSVGVEDMTPIPQSVPTVVLNFTKADFEAIKISYENGVNLYLNQFNKISYDKYKGLFFTNKDSDIIAGFEWEFVKVVSIGKETFYNDGGGTKEFDYIDIEVNQIIYWKPSGYINGNSLTLPSVEVVRFYKLYKKYYDNTEDFDFEHNTPYEFRIHLFGGADIMDWETYPVYTHLTYTDSDTGEKTVFSSENFEDLRFVIRTEASEGIAITDTNLRNKMGQSVMFWSQSWDLRTKYYPKNMFLVSSNQKTKPTLVYEEYTEENFPYEIHELDVDSVMYPVKTNNGYCINIQNRNFRTIGKWKFDINKGVVQLFYGEKYYSVEFTSNNEKFIGFKQTVSNDVKKLYYITAYEELIEVYNSNNNSFVEKYETIIIKKFTNTKTSYEIVSWLEEYANKIESEYDVKSIQYWYKDYNEKNGIPRTSFYGSIDVEAFNHNLQNFADEVELKVLFRDGTNDVCDAMIIKANYSAPPSLYYNSIENGRKLVYQYGNNGSWINQKYRDISEICYVYGDDKQNIKTQVLKNFLNNNAYVINEENSFKFVFGVNLTENDKDKDNIEIYASLISNRDVNVYDENHNVIGKVRNYIENSEDSYGTDQYYDDIME